MTGVFVCVRVRETKTQIMKVGFLEAQFHKQKQRISDNYSKMIKKTDKYLFEPFLVVNRTFDCG